MPAPKIEELYYTVAEVAATGHDPAVQDLITRAPMVAGHPVLDLVKVWGDGVNVNDADTRTKAALARIGDRLDLLDNINLVVYPPSDVNSPLYGESAFPSGGMSRVAGVYHDDTLTVLIALGDDDENLQAVVRANLDPALYTAGRTATIAHLRDEITGVAGLEERFAREFPTGN
jgi:hypothetical protein